VQAAYEVGPTGTLSAPVPERCPFGEDGSDCLVTRHDQRARKSGPEHAIVVCRCRTHSVYFTVYPPGHVPYGRVAVVASDAEGRTVAGDALDDTLFGAAAEASSEASARRTQRRTLVRRLELCAALLALTASADAVRAAVAGALWLPQLRLRETAQQYALKRHLRERAQAVLSLLAQISQQRLRTGILVAGHIAGLWGRPSRWDPGGRMLRPLV
jgi:hypothetical protein